MGCCAFLQGILSTQGSNHCLLCLLHWHSLPLVPLGKPNCTYLYIMSYFHWGFSAGSKNGKEPACNAGDPGSVPGLQRSPGGRHGNPFQYSCLENLMDGGAWQATVHGVQSRVAAAFSSYDGDLTLPLGLALGSPIFPSGCEGKLGVALESLQGRRDLT